MITTTHTPAVTSTPHLGHSGIEEGSSRDHLVHVQESLHLAIDGFQLLLAEVNASLQHLWLGPVEWEVILITPSVQSLPPYVYYSMGEFKLYIRHQNEGLAKHYSD